jgi:hypothetical protein
MRKLAMFVRFVAVGACALALSARAKAADDLDAPPPTKPEAAAAADHGPGPAPGSPSAPLPVPGSSERPVVATPGGEVVVFPTARLQVDGAFFPRQSPKSGVYIRRARVGLSGWLARVFYFDVSVDFTPPPLGGPDQVAPAMLSPTDDYLALAPPSDRLIVQAGQFDVPFTLENRTSDAYTDFIERSMAVRLLGAPRNKDVGGMVHGLVGDVLYYSGGVFNGEGPGFRNLDDQPEIIGRVVVSPFGIRNLAIGGSGWYGRHVLGPMFPLQSTPGGVRFFAPHWTTGQATPLALELREQGTVTAFAGEVNLPLGRRLGLRAEGVFKRQQLVEADVSLQPTGPVLPLGNATFQGIAGYGELWIWLVGDDRLLPAPGLELPVRLGPEQGRAFDDGLMFALRGEFLKEDLTSDAPALGDPNRATTRVVSGTAGLNYWRGHLVRFSINYVANYWSGTSESIKAQKATGPLEHELLLRFAMSL